MKLKSNKIKVLDKQWETTLLSDTETAEYLT